MQELQDKTLLEIAQAFSGSFIYAPGGTVNIGCTIFNGPAPKKKATQTPSEESSTPAAPKRRRRRKNEDGGPTVPPSGQPTPENVDNNDDDDDEGDDINPKVEPVEPRKRTRRRRSDSPQHGA